MADTPKPDWWPKCPYPKAIFPMEEDEYPKIVPDPHTRTALSGCLGRLFWSMASEMIWERFQEHLEELSDRICVWKKTGSKYFPWQSGCEVKADYLPDSSYCQYCGGTITKEADNGNAMEGD